MLAADEIIAAGYQAHDGFVFAVLDVFPENGSPLALQLTDLVGNELPEQGRRKIVDLEIDHTHRFLMIVDDHVTKPEILCSLLMNDAEVRKGKEGIMIFDCQIPVILRDECHIFEAGKGIITEQSSVRLEFVFLNDFIADSKHQILIKGNR